MYLFYLSDRITVVSIIISHMPRLINSFYNLIKLIVELKMQIRPKKI